jgi:hypothetical protein
MYSDPFTEYDALTALAQDVYQTIGHITRACRRAMVRLRTFRRITFLLIKPLGLWRALRMAWDVSQQSDADIARLIARMQCAIRARKAGK